MSHVPSGFGPGGEPLTALEGATLLGLQKWITANESYFKKSERYSRMLKIGLLIWIGEFFLQYYGYEPGLFVSISIILIIAALIFRKNLHAVPVIFPIPVISIHPYVKFRGNAHLVSTSSDAELSFSVKNTYPKYQNHHPEIGNHESQHQIGIREHAHLSLGSIGTFSDEVRDYSQIVIDTEYESHDIQILIGIYAEEIKSYITTDFSPAQLSLCANVQSQEQNSSESQYIETAFNSITNSIDENIESNRLYIDQVTNDLSKYSTWRDKLVEISNDWTGTVLLSARYGWDKMADASEDASVLLTDSVRGKIDAMKVKIENDASEALADLESKIKDVEAEVASKGIDLERQIEAQRNIAKEAHQSQLDIQNSNTPPEISLSIPVSYVSGGGGYVGEGGGSISSVSTVIRHERVSFPNPAFQVKGHVLELAKSISKIEESRLEGFVNQKSGLANIITDRKERIEERKEQRKREADERMEIEKNVALRHAHLVESLYGNVYSNSQLLDFRDIDSLVKKSWSRPSNILDKHIEPIENEIARLTSVLKSLEEEFVHIESYLLPNALSPVSAKPVHAHWAHTRGNALTDGFVNCQPLDVFQNQSVQIKPSRHYHLLQPKFDEEEISPLKPEMIRSAMQSLQLRGSFLPRLLKHLDNLEMEEICLTDSNLVRSEENEGGHENPPYPLRPPNGGA